MGVTDFLPEPLRPAHPVKIWLPSGRTILLPHCQPAFARWKGSPLAFTFGNKMLLEHDGIPVFAEIKILRLLECIGWEGVWASSFGGMKLLREMPSGFLMSGVAHQIPEERRNLLNAIGRQAGTRGGCFDIFAEAR